jgi:DNA-binding MarR family transcriptional regulator
VIFITGLTKSQQKVLNVIRKHPLLSGNKLAKKAGMNPSNLSTVKRQLMRKGILNQEIILSLHAFPEMKIMSFAWVEYRTPVIKGRVMEELKKLIVDYPRILVVHSYNDSLYALMLFPDYAEAEGCRLEFQTRLSEHVKEFFWKNMPLEDFGYEIGGGKPTRYLLTSKIPLFPLPPPLLGKPGESRLKGMEKKVLMALVRYPTLSNKEISEKLGILPSNFARAKKHLESGGVLLSLDSVNVQKVTGSTAVVCLCLEHKAGESSIVSQEINKLRKKYQQPSMYLTSKGFRFGLIYFKSFEMAEDYRLDLEESLDSHIKEFHWKCMPIEHLKSANLQPMLLDYVLNHKKPTMDELREKLSTLLN